jgi:hypothetical protein
LWRELPFFIDKAVPNIDINNACLLGSASVEFVEIRRIFGGLRIDATIAALKSAGIPVIWVGVPSQRGALLLGWGVSMVGSASLN